MSSLSRSVQNIPHALRYTFVDLMNHTQRTLALAAAWLFLVPLVALPLVFLGGPAPAIGLAASVVWSLGFVALFARWSWHDAPSHGKSKNVAAIFTAAWFLVFFLAVFPYLFVTRGARAGVIAALQFLCFCIACGTVWMAIPFATRALW